MFNMEVPFSAPQLNYPPFCVHQCTKLSCLVARLPWQVKGCPDARKIYRKAHRGPCLCGFIISLPYFATVPRDCLFTAGSRHTAPEALSPRDMTRLLEPCLKNAARLTAVVGKMQDFNWFWLQNSDHSFPWRCALQETILPKPGSFYTFEVNQVAGSFVMGKRKRAFEHLITIFCNCWATGDITKCSWWPAAPCLCVRKQKRPAKMK